MLPNCIARLILVVLSAVFISSCDESSDVYFPLKKGLKWHYEITKDTPHYNKTEYLAIENIGKKYIDGKDIFIRRTSLGTDYYLLEQEGNVVRVAKRTAVELRPRFDEEVRYVLKSPHLPGTSWTYAGRPYLLDRPFPTDYELQRIVNFPMTYKIISTGEEVQTKAGLFKNCLHIQGEATVDIGRILTITRDEVKFTTNEWYAPGVGLVKLTRIEDVDSKHAYGGAIKMDLVEFTK